MSNDQRSHVIAQHFLKALLHGFFSGCIERGGGLIDDHEDRIAHRGSADHEALLFASGEFNAVPADASIDSIGKPVAEVDLQLAHDAPQLFVRDASRLVSEAVEQVVTNGAIKD